MHREAAWESAEFYEQNLPSARAFDTDLDLLRYAVQRLTPIACF